MKKKYVEPKMEMIRFDYKEVVSASGDEFFIEEIVEPEEEIEEANWEIEEEVEEIESEMVIDESI